MGSLKKEYWHIWSSTSTYKDRRALDKKRTWLPREHHLLHTILTFSSQAEKKRKWSLFRLLLSILGQQTKWVFNYSLKEAPSCQNVRGVVGLIPAMTRRSSRAGLFKLFDANPGLKINHSINFCSIKMFFTAYAT